MNTRKRTWFEAMWQSGAILLFAVMIGLSVNQLRSDKLPLVADRATKTLLNLDAEDGLRISAEKAESLLLSPAAVFLDARSEESYELGHIKGARSLPWDGFERCFEEVLGDLDQNVFIITYCDGKGCNLGEDVALALFDKGYVNVYVLEGGWSVWQQNNLPVERGSASSCK